MQRQWKNAKYVLRNDQSDPKGNSKSNKRRVFTFFDTNTLFRTALKRRSADVPYLHTVIQLRKMRIWNSFEVFFYFLCFFFYTKVNGTLWTLNCFRKCETLSSLRTMQTRQCLLSFNSETKKKLIAFDLHYRKNKSRV